MDSEDLFPNVMAKLIPQHSKKSAKYQRQGEKGIEEGLDLGTGWLWVFQHQAE